MVTGLGSPDAWNLARDLGSLTGRGGDPMTRPDDPVTSAHDPQDGTGTTPAEPGWPARTAGPRSLTRRSAAPAGPPGPPRVRERRPRTHAYSAFPDEACSASRGQLTVPAALQPVPRSLPGRVRADRGHPADRGGREARGSGHRHQRARHPTALPGLRVRDRPAGDTSFALPTTIIFLVGAALGMALGPPARPARRRLAAARLLAHRWSAAGCSCPRWRSRWSASCSWLLPVALAALCSGPPRARRWTASPPGRRARWASPWPPP